jgi:arylformamidase
MIYDITPRVTERLGVWPGDTAMSREVLCDMKKGANITLSTIRTTVHLGAHADGPNHYSRDGAGIGERKLEYYLGPCVLLETPVQRGERVGIEQVERDLRIAERWTGSGRGPDALPQRVLLRTGTFPDPEKWNADFAGIEPSLIDWLSERGVITVGIDTPSVDVQESKDLPAHAAFARHDMAILEGLALGGVPAGVYELIALPLRLVGCDASPVRAVLRTM